ncbi:MAG: hypothetical protein Q7T74_01690 [Candidatus Saccharibacteria bacterium]|nr:hypothetical protein [Candidatus Saccharibacteria bacterium]
MNGQFPDWVYLTVYLAFPYAVAFMIAAALGNHEWWCTDVVRRQLLEVAITIVGAILPAFTYGIVAESVLVGFVVLPVAPIPLIVMFRINKRKYNKRVFRAEFMALMSDGDDLPHIVRSTN